MHLTPAGEIVYATAKRMLDEEDRLLRTLDTGHEGRVKFGASMAFEQQYFLQRVSYARFWTLMERWLASHRLRPLPGNTSSGR